MNETTRLDKTINNENSYIKQSKFDESIISSQRKEKSKRL
jgi:hypothetical protein